MNKENQIWSNVKNLLGNNTIDLGRHWSYNLYNDPKRLAFVLSRYKFAAKMSCSGKRVLELGCSEGIGATILSELALNYTGVDLDKDAIETASKNWKKDKITFIPDDFLGKVYGKFDAVISLDVVEHIEPSREQIFFDTVYDNLDDLGVGVIGTPNITASAYASAASQIGHYNLFDAERLKKAMNRIFHNVFIFGINDEIVHTSFSPMAHFLICIGCYKR